MFLIFFIFFLINDKIILGVINKVYEKYVCSIICISLLNYILE